MSWDGPSCVIGIFIGMSILLIISWICYSTRTFIYVDIPLKYPECRFSNYFNNPGNAIANGSKVEDILTLNKENRMIYQRVPKDVCVPASNQDIRIFNPQYCLFSYDDNGVVKTLEGKNTFYESPHYTATLDGQTIDITSLPNCQPASNNAGLTMTGGIPEIKWDAKSNA